MIIFHVTAARFRLPSLVFARNQGLQHQLVTCLMFSALTLAVNLKLSVYFYLDLQSAVFVWEWKMGCTSVPTVFEE